MWWRKVSLRRSTDTRCKKKKDSAGFSSCMMCIFFRIFPPRGRRACQIELDSRFLAPFCKWPTYMFVYFWFLANILPNFVKVPLQSRRTATCLSRRDLCVNKTAPCRCDGSKRFSTGTTRVQTSITRREYQVIFN